MNKKKFSSYQIVSFLITIGFIFVSIFVFPNAFVRIKESLIDLWNSLRYYISQFLYLENEVTPTINDYSVVPMTPIFNLPTTWEEFKIEWNLFWDLFFTGTNVSDYFWYALTTLLNIAKIVLLIGLPVFLILAFALKRHLAQQNNDYNEDTKPLKVFKLFSSKFYTPIKTWILNFVEYVKNSNFFKLWLLIWLWNFNIITIFIEFIAFYLYFVISFDMLNIYRQIYKLLCDLSVPIAFFPVPILFFIIYLVVCSIRKKIGYKRLNHFERKNRGFINERPIVMMVCGTMGKKKTTIITDVALSEEIMLRDKALELLMKNDMRFPNFPWINLENELKRAVHYHQVYNLSTIRKFIIKKHWRWRKDSSKENIFDYDYERYGLTYDNGLEIMNIWKVLESYAKLYFVYTIESSLILSNYSIRTDNVLESAGNFPLWETELFKRDSKDIDLISRHAHILDFDSMRLGKKVIEDNYKKDSFEFGVINITEVGKERKNNLSLQEMKVKDALANQKNDGFNDMLKMIRHNATIDNFPFVKIITDEQRPESWGADARDLLEVVTIDEANDTRLAMPFFMFTDMLYNWMKGKFDNFYLQYRYNRADNTFLMYTIKKVMSTFHHYHERIHNTFNYIPAKVQIENGTQDGNISEKKYYIMSKKIYARRFSTDCFSDFFAEKTARSSIGINDLEEYKTEKASFEELSKQNSYFIDELMNKKIN